MVKLPAVRHALKTGFSFGLTSGIITTLGLMVGLHSGTHSKPAVIGGIMIIAIADAFSDALGIHIAEESENKHTHWEIWEATAATFFFKFLVASSFIIPVLVLPLALAIIVSIIWGMFWLGILSFFLGKGEGQNPWPVVFEHLLIMIAVVVSTHFIGEWIATVFG